MEQLYNSTIAAISTAMSNSGIGIVRMSGPEAFQIADRVYKGKKEKKLCDQKSHTIHYGYIVDGEQVIDEVLVMLMRGPHSYTGEDTVEINCHGGVYVVKRILEVLIKNGARPAEPGEYTKRAFLNGRLDLSQAEAVGEYFDEVTKESVPHKEGLQDLLEYLKEHEIPAVVATSTERKRASRLIHMSGIEHLISNAIYGDMVERGKPEPDIFLKAAELIGQDPKECLVLEDSAPGLLAGKAAGGYTIYVPDIAVVSKEAKEGITAELADLHEVAAWIRKENKK